MDSAALREAYRCFTTSVALITTHGSKGPNVMAAEWTFNVSYDPFLIEVLVDPGNVTHEAIVETKEFGVNLASDEQAAAMAFAGHYSKRETDKLSSELFETYPATKIRAPLMRGCLLNAECRLVKQVTMGDHTAFVGEVVAFSIDPSRKPVILHRGPRHLGPRIERDAALVVAATPMDTTPGSTIALEGELMVPERGAKAIQLQLVDEDGAEVAEATVETDAHGNFLGKLVIPSDARPGTYQVLARSGEVQGKALVRIR